MSGAKENAPAEVSGTGRQVWASEDGKTNKPKCTDSRAAVVEAQRAKEREQPTPLVTTPPHRKTILSRLLAQQGGNDFVAQAERMLRGLQQAGHVTSHEAREYLGVYHPAARVMTLRQRGYPIETIRVRQVCGDGRTHVIGMYLLRPASKVAA